MSETAIPRLFPSRLALRAPRAGGPGPAIPPRLLLPRLWIEQALLDRRLAQECARPRPDDALLRDLRQARLALRDRIQAARRARHG